jgi:hydroxymethylglutaryl-CoA lyase
VPGQEQGLIQAAYEAGCLHFDTAIGGFGGCPMAKDELTGNLSTEALLAFMQTQQIESQLDLNAFEKARIISQSIFN